MDPGSTPHDVSPPVSAPPDSPVRIGVLASGSGTILEAILAADDPASLAERIPRSVGTHLAADCVAAAQRLARLGQLLRSLAA